MTRPHRILLVSVALLCLMMLAAPALAKENVPKCTWNWNGITVLSGYNDPTHTEIAGSEIQLTGKAYKDSEHDSGWWTGRGTGVFIDNTLGLKAKLTVWGGYAGPGPAGDVVFNPYGVASVTVNDLPVGTYPFALYVSDFGSGYPRGLDLSLTDYPGEGLSTGWALTDYTGAGLSGSGLHSI